MKYEDLISHQSKDMANVKAFADKQTDKLTDGQTDERTGQKLHAPDLSTDWWHENHFVIHLLKSGYITVLLCSFHDTIQIIDVLE